MVIFVFGVWVSVGRFGVCGVEGGGGRGVGEVFGRFVYLGVWGLELV